MSKVKVAFVDKDLRVRKVKSFPLTDDGERIQIHPKGGKGNENPVFTNTSSLGFQRRSPIPPFRRYFENVYFMRTGATSCFDFANATVTIPDLDRDRIKESMGAILLNEIGKPKEQFPTWLIWMIAIINILVLVMMLRGG